MPKLTIQCDDQVHKVLEEMAERKGKTKEEIIRRAPAMYKYLDDETSGANKCVSITSAEDDRIVKDIVMLKGPEKHRD